MIEFITISISIIALIISAITAWLTYFKRGTIKMTRPTLIVLTSDIRPSPKERLQEKIFLRSLLFSTSKRGRVIENMYATLTRDHISHKFSFWGYGEENLNVGSGLFVPESGILANHHFLIAHNDVFHFSAGEYELDIYAQLFGDTHKIKMFHEDLIINVEAQQALKQTNTGLFFHWDPDSQTYITSIDKK